MSLVMKQTRDSSTNTAGGERALHTTQSISSLQQLRDLYNSAPDFGNHTDDEVTPRAAEQKVILCLRIIWICLFTQASAPTAVVVPRLQQNGHTLQPRPPPLSAPVSSPARLYVRKATSSTESRHVDNAKNALTRKRIFTDHRTRQHRHRRMVARRAHAPHQKLDSRAPSMGK